MVDCFNHLVKRIVEILKLFFLDKILVRNKIESADY